MPVRSHPYLVVVAQHQPEFDLLDLLFGAGGAVDEGRAVEVVAQADFLGAIGGEVSFAYKAAFDNRFEADLFTDIGDVFARFFVDFHSRQIVDNYIGTGREEGSTTNSVFGGVVAQDNFNGGNGVILVQGEFAADRIAGEAINDGIELMRIDAG